MKEQTAEEKLKSKGITPLTKHHNYDYLYCSVVDLLQEQAKEIERLKAIIDTSDKSALILELYSDLDERKVILNDLAKEIERLKGENNKIKFFTDNNIDINKLLRFTTPYPIHEVLKGLTECADVLLHEKGYDRAGWERLEYCYRHGVEIIELFEPKPIN